MAMDTLSQCPTLDLDELACEIMVTTLEEGFDGCLLGFESKAASALCGCGNPVVDNVTRLGRGMHHNL